MTNSNKLSRDELITELIRLADELGDPPSVPEMNKHGKYSAPPYYRVFGSWPAALQAAGFEATPSPDKRSRDELLAEIRRLTDNDDPPSQSHMKAEGKYAVSTYRSHFGSWTAALREAGFEPPTSGTRLTDSDLCEALVSLSDELGQVPTSQDMNEHGSYSPGTYINRFGSWNDALAAAGLESPTEQRPISEEALVDGIKNLAKEFGRPPTTTEMNNHGSYHAHTYRLRFGSWDAALEAAGAEGTSESADPPNKIDRDALLEEIRALAAAQDDDQPPTTTMMKKQGQFSVGTYINRFGSWGAAVNAAQKDDEDNI
jgi:hypothetical protein